MSVAPGRIRDSIISYLDAQQTDASLAEIGLAVADHLGPVSPSSIRSYLNLNTPGIFSRTSKGRYSIAPGGARLAGEAVAPLQTLAQIGKASLYMSDCMSWLGSQPANSIHAVVTDPPYGLKEYSPREQSKLRRGRGGLWRIPPSFDGHLRSPLPRFTILDEQDKNNLTVFFKTISKLLFRVLVPGANVAIASNPLLAHLVSAAFVAGGLEVRGSIVRLTMTMRGGDRPKNAHQEFAGVSVMPRSMWEPWVIARKPLDGRVQDNLRKWKTGGWRRPSADRPFGDVIRSSPTSSRERRIANHPSLKPQSFLRQLAFAALPLGEGIILDPFAGSGSTLAACNAIGYRSIGVEKDEVYAQMAVQAIDSLSRLKLVDPVGPQLFDPLTM